MDENSDVFESFEYALKQKNTVSPLALYKNSKTRNITDTTHNQKPSAQSVIAHVANQIKAMQNSEAVRSDRKPVEEMYKYRNFSFLPLNELQDRVPRRPPEQQKFETQHFSNTQLINIVEDAEALDVNVGMTQEFETTFLYGEENTDVHHKESPEQKNISFPILDISLKEPDPNLLLVTFPANHKRNKSDDNTIKPDVNLKLPVVTDTLINGDSQSNKVVDEFMEIDDIEDLDAIEQDTDNLDTIQEDLSQQNCTQKPPSPIFNVKSKKPVPDTEFPLVFDLELFEHFENIAMPIVQTTPDVEQAKFLINSQIVANESVIHTYMEDTEPLSPIIELSDNLLKVDKASITKTCIDWSYKEKVDEKLKIHKTQESKSKESSQTEKYFFEDEILFSSDEEEAYHQRSYKDLPFTCALETSFYEQNEILDKTMYVGFQTASNKSIQIGTESFCRAKSFLDSIRNDLKSEGTLTDLVEICEMKKLGTTDSANVANTICVDDNSKNDSFSDINIPYNDSCPVKNTPNEHINDFHKNNVHVVTEEQSIDDDLIREFQEDLMHTEMDKILKNIDSEEDQIIKKSKIIEYGQNIGFKTASNKIINISDKALAKSKKLFQDINIDETLDNAENSFNNDMKTVNIDIKITEETTHFFDIIDLNEDAKDCNLLSNEKVNTKDRSSTNKNTEVSENTEVHEKPLIKSNDADAITEVTGFKTVSSIDIKGVDKVEDVESPFFGFDNNEKLIEETLEKSQKILEKLTQYNKLNLSKTDLPNTRLEKSISNNFSDTNKHPNESLNAFQDLQPFRDTPGFRTASNKEVKISELALEKSKKILQETNEDKSLETIRNIDKNTQSDIKFKGFQTASNKDINISESALAKSRLIFQDISDSKNTTHLNADVVNQNNQFKGFRTASHKEVKISEEALAKSKKIFEDIQVIDNTTADTKEKVEVKTLLKGFQTASNKQISVSEKALARSRKLFQDLSEEKLLEKTNVNNSTSVKKNVDINLKFKGFHTASNKKVNISEKALVRSKKIFEDIPDIVSLETDSKDVHTKSEENIKESTFKGFQTANSKEVSISQAALAKSRQLFQDADDKAITNKSNYHNAKTTSNSKFQGFKTASNREVQISAEAIAKSKRLFQDINDDIHVQADHDVNTINNESIFKGFQTANKKEVKISAEALAKSKKIFLDIIDNKPIELDAQTVELGVKTISTFRGFQTASNKEVKVSKEAIAKSKKLFHDIDYGDVGSKNNDTDLEGTNSNFIGFQTASNKNVKISEEAIAKSKELFQDLDTNSNTATFKCYDVAFQSKPKVTEFKISSYDKKNVLSGETLTQPKKLFSENIEAGIKMQSTEKQGTKASKNCTENFTDVDTQLLNNFEESMHEVTPKKSKRSGSPILSCPKAKKRKLFQIPYSQKSPKKASGSFKIPDIVEKSENMYNFSVRYKKLKRFYLKDLHRLEETTAGQTNVDPYIQKFDFENILEFELAESRNDVTKSVLTLIELKKIFLNSVNKNLVPEGWLEIQLKLILWKLISYEIKFPKSMPLTCTAKNLLEQLKYRYDRELYNAERPALRKIFERDDIAAKTLVLCVVAVCDVPDASQPPELLLTDGWYIIKAVIDKMLAKLVGNGKITVGTKLLTNGAELVGAEQAVSPWEDTSSIRLKIFGNSTRRARWDSRLGYHGNAAILSQLSTVSMDGGKVSKLRVFVTRVYPPLYVDKFEDGSTVTRSERLEHLHQMKFEMERQALLEKIYEDVEKEVYDQNTQDSEGDTASGSKRKCLDSGSQIAKIMKRSRDPNEFRSHLTSTQTALLEDHTTKEREKLLQEIQTRVQSKMAAQGVTLNRNVVTLFKVRVAGVDERKGGVEVTKALLSIWRPNEAVIEMIKEGSWIEILNVVPTALRYSELHVSAGRQSIFSQSKHKDNEKLKPFTESLKRTCYPIKDLVKSPAMTTDYNEIDTVGIIFEIDPAVNYFDLYKHQFQNVFLADADKNIISINFWGGLKKFGFENILDTGQIVACTNLQKRAGNSRKNIPQYRVTEFSYFTKTPKNETARKIIEVLEQHLLKIDKNVFYKECITLKNNYFAKQKTNDNVTPYRFPNMDINLSKNKIFIDSPIAQNSNKKDENLNLTGLDFDSTFKEANAQDLSPKTLLRKRQVRERIAKLKRYGEPPPLSPIQIINKSKNAANAFKSPLISKSDVSPSVANSQKILPNEEKCGDVSDIAIQCSPVINLNRTYVKRSNPVKLNFSKNENSISEAVDEFAEEFDCSPPLSLD